MKETVSTGIDQQNTPYFVRQAGRLPHQRAFWAVAYAFTVTVMGSTLPAPLYVIYQQLWHFSAVMLTLIYATYVAGVMVALLCFGQLSDQLGRRRVLIGGVSIALCAGLLFVLAQGVVWLFSARFVTGIAVGLCMGTANATLIEMRPQRERHLAGLVGTISSVMGFGLGPLIAGTLAQYAIWPTRLAFFVYLGLLILALFCVSVIPETVQITAHQAPWRPQRLSVPTEVRTPFIIASIVLFCDFSTLGLFTSLAPSLVISLLHLHNMAISGAMISIVFASSIIAQFLLQRLPYRSAISIGMIVLIIGLLLMVLAFFMQSLPIFLASTLILGVGQGISYMGSLLLVNQIAPPLRRGEVLSSYFVIGYIGTALPVLGMSLLIGVIGLYAATVAFALFIGILSLGSAVSVIVGKTG